MLLAVWEEMYVCGGVYVPMNAYVKATGKLLVSLSTVVHLIFEIGSLTGWPGSPGLSQPCLWTLDYRYALPYLAFYMVIGGLGALSHLLQLLKLCF